MTLETQSQKFVIVAINPETDCIANSLIFEVDNIQALKAIVDREATFRDFAAGYELDLDEVKCICRRFGIFFDPGTFKTEIRSLRPIDELPYKIHTGRELDMMLTGSKPLACFSESHPSQGTYAAPEQLFDPHVASGRFSKREYCIIIEPEKTGYGIVRGTKETIYSLAHESWRIDSYILVIDSTMKFGWGDAIERIVESLLGYEDWQNDAYIQYLHKIKSL